MLKLRPLLYLLLALSVNSAWTHRIDRNEAWKFLLRSSLAKVQQRPITTCRQSNLSPGCCKWQGQTCFVEGGNCYCDNQCELFGDCCCDVPAPLSCDSGTPRRGSNRCASQKTTSYEHTTENPTTIITTTTTTVAPVLMPNTCTAHYLNTGPDGCCPDGDSCFIEGISGSCYCDRMCHRENTCCSDVMSSGCYPRTCSEAGMKQECCSISGDQCRVQTSHNTSCYCGQKCVAHGDCCSDAMALCSQIQDLSEPGVGQIENMLAVIESDNSALYEKMTAAFWRRYNKKKRKERLMSMQRKRA